MIAEVYRKRLPASVRQRIWNFRINCREAALKLKLEPIRVDACLRGGDNGVPAAIFARMIGDIRRASAPISEWPHTKLLRQYDSVGDHIWESETFKDTDYFRNAALNIEIFGNYHSALTLDQIEWGARRFICAYSGRGEMLPPQEGEHQDRHPLEHIAVHPVKDSACYQVHEGHHRLAIAYMRGVREVPGLILKPPVTTPVQDLLREVLWLKGRRELYQPVNSPEVADWILVRRCSDRLEKMTEFLKAEGLMPPAQRSYLDVACSYGWFVAEMTKLGFRAEGLDRDPIALAVGKVMYGLRPEQLYRGDAVTFLRGLKEKYDVTSCFSLAHHYILNRKNASVEDLIHLMDSTTRSVMFFDMGQSHEYTGDILKSWDADYIHRWLEANTTFTQIVRLGTDEDAVPPNQHNFGRMLFACLR
jgi:2-polyprenyl-3-methyl-5-hydroxy-6-metoxy-1,4-benzoquinol methylase